MKSILIGIGAMIVVGVLAWAVLGTQTKTSSEEFTSSNNSVRLN